MQIFFSRSHPSPDVALRLVDVQHLAGLPGERRVDLNETVGYVFMYGSYYF